MTLLALTDEQRLAVARRTEPLLLSAAAGSGKTSVLVERFVAAVREDAIAPSQILAITFTERAAGELRARVRARLLELGERELARDTEAAFIGTFHGFCARVLRSHPLPVGLDPAFAIIEEGLAGRLRASAFAQALREFLATPEGEAVDLIAAYGLERTRAMIEQVYAELRSRGQRLPRLPACAVGEEQEEAARACVLLDQLLRGFALAYEHSKRVRGVVDFDDLELLTRELLSSREDLRRSWAERFELLMVDEFQDTNARQLDILATLERGNLFTVGDELQSIYSFRHADVSLFRARREQLEEVGGSLRLTRNFRSDEALLHVVNAVFAERFIDYAPLVPGRESLVPGREPPVAGPSRGRRSTTALPQDHEDVPVELLLTDVRGWEQHPELVEAISAGLPHAQLWRQAEARMLAQRVAELVGAGLASAGEVVVLLRAMGDLEVFEHALQLQGLRTLASVGAFWGHQQVTDLLCWLRALANPLDEQALYGALASPLGGCSLDCLALLARAARETRGGLWRAALATVAEGSIELADADRNALASFCALLAREREGSARRPIAELIERALELSGYHEHVLALEWPERRLANVHKLLRLARRFQASEGRDLRAFLDHVAYLEQADHAEPEAPVASATGEDGVEPDAVRLMTIHAAKGLEFPVVCLADLGRQPNTGTPDLLVRDDRIGVRLMRLDGSKSTPALDYEELSRERREREAEEEDRILYVAMTRARERLLLSGAVDFARWPSAQQGSTPIAWLVPALSAELPELARSVEASVHDLSIGGDEVISVRCRLNTPATVGEVLRLERAPARAPAPPGGRVAEAGPGGSVALVGGPEAGGEVAVVGEQLSFLPDGAPSHIQSGENGGQVSRRQDARPVVEPTSLPSSLSYTSLSELERCGYRYYLERVLGLPEQPASGVGGGGRRGLDPRARGTLIHRVMELELAPARAVRGASGASELSAEVVGEVARQLGMRVTGAERDELAQLISSALAAEPAARVRAARQVHREYPFAFAVGAQALLINGVIDLLAREADGTCLIVDYKSDRLDDGEDLRALVDERYAVQRELYALALLRTGVVQVEVLHWFLERPHEPVSARYGGCDRDHLQARLQERVERAGEDQFAVSQRPYRELCLTCPGRAGLCSWSDAETLREKPGGVGGPRVGGPLF